MPTRSRRLPIHRAETGIAGRPNDFKQQISALIDRINATPRQPGVSEIGIRASGAFRSREQALRDGIEIDRVVYEALKSLRLD
jgi:LDH2 family malate/lactate/ureidoglycolate dehydrogenase